MSSVTEEQVEQEQRTEEPAGTLVRFRSKGANFKVVRRPEVTEVTSFGLKTLAKEVSYDFSPNGELEVEVGDGAMEDMWSNGEKRDVVAFLRAHPNNADALGEGENSYFWEVGREPGRQLPTEDELFDRIVEATAILNLEALAEIEAEEAGSHGRPLILNAIAAARRKIEQVNEGLGDGKEPAQDPSGGDGPVEGEEAGSEPPGGADG